jgi:hypothetical protein
MTDEWTFRAVFADRSEWQATVPADNEADARADFLRRAGWYGVVVQVELVGRDSDCVRSRFARQREHT